MRGILWKPHTLPNPPNGGLTIYVVAECGPGVPVGAARENLAVILAKSATTGVARSPRHPANHIRNIDHDLLLPRNRIPGFHFGIAVRPHQRTQNPQGGLVFQHVNAWVIVGPLFL